MDKSPLTRSATLVTCSREGWAEEGAQQGSSCLAFVVSYPRLPAGSSPARSALRESRFCQ